MVVVVVMVVVRVNTWWYGEYIHDGMLRQDVPSPLQRDEQLKEVVHEKETVENNLREVAFSAAIPSMRCDD